MPSQPIITDAAVNERYSGTKQSHLGKSAFAVDEQIVEHDVEHIAKQQHPHSQTRVSHSVGKLLQCSHPHERNVGKQNNHIVGTYERQQLLGLPDVVDKAVESHHGKQCHCSKDEVEHKRIAHGLAYLLRLTAGKERTYYGCDSVGETHASHHHKGKHIVHKRCRCQCFGGVVPHHHSVGKACDDYPELSEHNGQSQLENRRIIVLIVAEAVVSWHNL